MIRLSPTAVLKYETCPYQYLLEEVLRIRPTHRAANLVFGSVMHRTVEDWLRGELTGAVPDPIACFDREWATARDAGGIEYAATQSPASLTATGRALITGFATAWPTFQRLLAVDEQGAPLLELKLDVQLGPRLVFVGRIDLLTFTSDGELECLDLKTPSTPTNPDWLLNADQLTGYQLLLDAYTERLGLPPIKRLGLLELIKRKVPTQTGKGPEVRAPITVPRHSTAEVADYAQKVRWVAEDIERGRFPKRGLMAHNTPCELCAVRGLCQSGDTEGLIVPPQTALAAVSGRTTSATMREG